MIIIEGIIGSGKSTLTDHLAEKYGLKAFYEPVESNPILEKYYKDPKRYGFEMQLWLLSHRLDLHNKAVKYEWDMRRQTVFDRSIYGDIVFGKTNYLDGNMTTQQYDMYMKLRDQMLSYCLTPQLCIYLNVDIDRAISNIKMRGRECEKEMPREYLEKLSVNNREMLLDLRNRGCNVVEIDYNEFDRVKIYEEISKFTDGNK